MFNNWVQDQKDKYELLKHHGMFLGSFINPEAVKKMMDQTTVTSTDEEFENTFKELVENNKLVELESNKPKRRRRKRK